MGETTWQYSRSPFYKASPKKLTRTLPSATSSSVFLRSRKVKMTSVLFSRSTATDFLLYPQQKRPPEKKSRSRSKDSKRLHLKKSKACAKEQKQTSPRRSNSKSV